MIVNLESNGKWGRVVLQKDHTELAAQMSRVFGNDEFLGLTPKKEMEFLVLNHDRGWDFVDEHIGKDEATGLPYNLIKTPMFQLLGSGPDSAAYNEDFHPFCGLLSSMHVWGLFNGRYGLSDKVVVDMLQGDDRAAADKMLEAELRRQERLKGELAQMPDYLSFIDDDHLMTCYKQLQFFDTLSLHLNNENFDKPTETSFKNVPIDVAIDTDMELRPLGPNKYQLSPFPFAGGKIELEMPVYRVPVMEGGVDYRHVFLETKPIKESITIVE